jgi:hypothetical protein
MAYTTERRKEIGIEQGKIYKQKALDIYYANPNCCKHCGKVIEVPPGKKPGDIRQKKFCNHSCAARFNNQGVDRWGEARVFKQRVRRTIDRSDKVCICESCGSEIAVKTRKRLDGTSYWYQRQYCDDCLVDVRRQSHKTRAEKNGYTSYFDKIEVGLTFGGLKDLFKDKGYYWFRSIISGHARRVIKANKREFKCEICGFDIQVDVCHRKDVAKFKPEDKILDINSNNNLVVLCPNHHIMFDKNIITI